MRRPCHAGALSFRGLLWLAILVQPCRLEGRSIDWSTG